MTRVLDIIRNVHTIVGYHIRRDTWKPAVCYLNASAMRPNDSKRVVLERGCDCLVTCKFDAMRANPGTMRYT